MLMSRKSDKPVKAKAYKNWSSLVDTVGERGALSPRERRGGGGGRGSNVCTEERLC